VKSPTSGDPGASRRRLNSNFSALGKRVRYSVDSALSRARKNALLWYNLTSYKTTLSIRKFNNLKSFCWLFSGA
jgi:hypothetical protein